MARLLTVDHLICENRSFQGTGGVSAHSRCAGFRPAFIDRATGTIYLSRNPDGSPAVCHRIDGLPPDVVARRDSLGRITALKATVEAGFERDGQFFSRAEAADLLGAVK